LVGVPITTGDVVFVGIVIAGLLVGPIVIGELGLLLPGITITLVPPFDGLPRVTVPPVSD
jgi:hypothetical protein